MTIGWRFDNSYSKLPDTFKEEVKPTPVNKPEIVIVNNDLAKELNLDFSKINSKDLAQIFSGNLLPDEAKTIAQAYAGHQFGHFTMLGDGRAVLLGEHLVNKNQRFDIQFKGSGKTSFSRRGDGRAALGPMLREYVISEAIHALNIPTTRSLAVVKTGEEIVREELLQGAILTRVASSHIRVGTFQYIAAKQDIMSIDQALSLYKLDNASIPTETQNLSSLVIRPENEPIPNNWNPSGYLKKVPFDPWGNNYLYRVLEDGYNYEILSLGADGKIGGDGINADINSKDF